MYRQAYKTKPWRHLYNTKTWKALREAQLREQPLCAYCMERGEVTPANVADHVKPHRGDEVLFYDPSNLQSLCKQCHDSAKQKEEKQGKTVGCNGFGVPLDTKHHWNGRG